MAALSYYSNWDSFPQWDSEVAAIDDPELQSLHDAWNADDYSVDLNALFDQNNSGNSSSSLLPYYDFDNGNGGVPFDNTLVNSFDELESFNYYYPKRQRFSNSDELYSSYFDPCLTMLQDYAPPEIPMLLPPLLLPEFSIGSVEKKEEAGGGGLSAQSIAARQRRRRITDKTRELGKLVPGGQKMNTAEMLDSARKYIKFMQAQVALLEAVAPPPPHHHHQELRSCEGGVEFQKLLESPVIQEKLYSTENCLLPIKFVEQLGSECQLLKSNPHFLSILDKEKK